MEILKATVTELNKHYCLALADSIVVERGAGALHTENQSGRIVFIGASHMRRILASDALKNENVVDDLPRWTPDADIAQSIIKKLEILKLNENDCVVMDLFSNDVYIGTDGKGFGSPPFKDQEGWHVEGALDVAPLKALRIIAKMAADLCGASGSAKVLMMLPLPRYVTAACCSSRRHVTNLDDADYESVLLTGSRVCRSVLEDELEGLGRQPVIYSPLAAFTGDDLRHTATSDGNSIWKETDPVHLSEAAYVEWGHAITSLWRSSEAGGRRRIASIIEEERRPGGRGGGRAGNRGQGGRGSRGWRGGRGGGWGRAGPLDFRFSPY
jgi:hypothetical protein